MTLQALLNIIGSIGIEDKLINFAGAGGSIYDINDLTIRDYPILYVSPTGTHRVEENFTSYQLTIFYIDRLLEDNSNGTNIHSTGVEVLKNIIRKVATLDGVIGVSDEYTINLFTETERMKDRCNGAYATLEITVLNDYVCPDYEGGSEDQSGETEYFRFLNEDREYVSSGETEYTVRWQTTAQSVRYRLSGATGEESGTTTDKQLTFDMGFNMEEAPQRFNLSVWAEIGGREQRHDLRWYHNPYWYIRFNPDVAYIGSAVTAYTAEFETNTKPTYKWELVDSRQSSVIISSGVSDEKRINLEFNPWIGSEEQRVMILTVFGRDSVGGEYTSESGTMWIVQENLVPEFEFVTPDNQKIGNTATTYTVSWNTNIPKLIWRCVGAESTPSSGVSTTSAVTVTFPANYTESGINRTIAVYYINSYGVEVLLGTRSWEQERMNEYLNILTPTGQQISSATTAFTIEWETNSQGPFEYSYTDQYGTVTGLTGGTAFTATFDENYTDYAIERTFTISGKSISWTQAEAEEPDWNNEHLTIRASSGGTLILYYTGDPQTKPELDVEFSVNRGEWKSYNQSTESDRTVLAGSRIRIRGNNATYSWDFHNGYVLAMTNDFKVAGNIMSLTYGDNFGGQTALTESYQFCALFEYHTYIWGTCVDARDLILPATQLTSGCYKMMFLEQVNLHGTPKLMAENVPSSAYAHMFNNCRNLEFIYCNATQLSNTATNNWFENASEGDIPCVFYRNPNYVWERGVSGIPLWMTIESIPQE